MSDLGSEEQNRDLRRPVEDWIQERIACLPNLSPEQIAEFVHELDVHRIQLQVQNEELRASQRPLALPTSEERFRKVFEEGPIGVVLADLDARIQHVNRRFCEMLGHTEDEIIALGVAGITHDEDWDADYQSGMRLLRDEIPFYTIEKRYVRKDRQVIWGHLTVSMIHDVQGKPTHIIGMIADISERKRAEEEIAKLNHDLQDQLAELQTILDTAPIGLAIARDADGNHIQGNPANERMLGVGPGGELSKAGPRPAPYRCLHEGRELSVTELPMQRAIRGETVTGQVMEVVREDGQPLTLYSSASPLLDKAGVPRGAVGAFLDITPLKRAEEALRESEQRHRLLWETMLQGVVYQDADGTIISMNPAAERILGKTRDEFLGSTSVREGQDSIRDDGSPFPGMDHPSMVALRTGQHVRGVVMGVYNPREQTRRWVKIDAVPLFRQGEDKPYQVYTVFDDVTDRKRAEERTRLLSEVSAQLLASNEPQRIIEALCRNVMDHLGCHVFFNFLADEEKRCLRLNAFAGVSEDAARQIEWLDFGVAVCGCVARDRRRIVAENIQTTSDPRTDLVRSFGIQTYACHPLMNQEQVIGTLSFGSKTKPAFTEDELELMKTVADHVAIAMQRIGLVESLKRQTQAAEAANTAKGHFLANMSHELRTPMNAILGMIDVALPKASDPTVQDCLRTAKGSADLLLTLLNDLLDSAKIESGKLELEMAPFSLRKMLDQITRALSVRASEKGLCFYCRMPEQTPDAVVGDRMRLQQVLLNLAGNAIKFTERGDVEIGVRSLSHDGEALLDFAVRDTGIGIPPAAMEHLFHPFTQADASTTRRFGGTGLGLSISKNLVERMGGTIRVESEVGRGSTFSFAIRLPLAKELPPDFEAPVALPTAACGQLRVLLVEDNPANQKLASYILQDRGHKVEIAGDGQEAIALTEQNRYDVILMDVQMPGMNGLGATEVIRKREGGGRRVPIIAMTAHAMKGDRERCLSAGMDGYLSKPINALAMLGLIESLAGNVVPVSKVVVAASKPSETSPPATPVVFNRQEALSRCCDQPDILQEVVERFFDEVESSLPQMRAALERGDLVEVGRLGHRMKGTLVYLGAEPARGAAMRVEQFCKSVGGTASDAEEAVTVLEHECSALKAALTEYLPKDGLRQGN